LIFGLADALIEKRPNSLLTIPWTAIFMPFWPPDYY